MDKSFEVLSIQFPLWCTELINRAKQADCHLNWHSEASPNAWRHRLIWRSDETSAVVTWLLGVAKLVSLCPLVRQNALCGVEISAEQPLSQTVLDELAHLPQLDSITLPAVLPRLDMPGLLLMDMDSTAIEIECIDELAKLAGVGDKVAKVTELAMQGQLDFTQSLRQRVATLAGADEAIIGQLLQQLPLMSGLEQMVAELQHYGWRVALASGGFTPFVDALRQRLGLDAAFANQLVIADNVLTGEVCGEIVDANRKAQILIQLAEQFAIAPTQCVAIGDGANDIPMVQQAALGIAFHGKDKLKQRADAAICQLDLQVLPFLLQQQGH
ncbi:phosphoserine phosphatase SerB [Shewanella sp. NFH-SH190041]|uniref:phosphoserine phosphatase SerB n=1 Tax=Shewanella sp. NFH-SH190041 TaxID=2950245 RepID=UPI0021C32794|nr:phosphoserine phosphatase SerB [Shewanella sp. NFH-SH190041]BDM65488.1 phosphoserine phosphatase SerB [Shewanella sp. NFH-SH190041]